MATEEQMDQPLISRQLVLILISVVGAQICLLLSALVSGVWWASRIDANAMTLKEMVIEIRSGNVTRSELQSTREYLNSVDNTLRTDIVELKGRVEQIAAQQRRTESIVMERNPRTR